MIRSENRKSSISRIKKSRKGHTVVYFATEGSDEEVYLWDLHKELKLKDRGVKFTFVSRKKSQNTPSKLVEAIRESAKIKDGDEIWLVCDKDRWLERDFMSVDEWSKESINHNYVISNPCFEVWLLFHCRDSNYTAGARVLKSKWKECKKKVVNNVYILKTIFAKPSIVQKSVFLPLCVGKILKVAYIQARVLHRFISW